MARRRIGQEDLIARPEPRAASSLAELAALLDWTEVDRALADISAAARGELGWPPLAHFRALLLATWPDLPDVRLAPSPSIRHDGEARWAGHRRRKPTHGYKAHVATDEGAGLVRGVEVTTANVHDAAELERVLPPEPGDVYGDSAFTGGPAERVIIARGGRPRTVWTAIWGRGSEALERLEAHNAAVRRVRCRIEKVFGTWKRSYGLRRMRWLGLAQAGAQVRLAAMAYNLRRSFGLLQDVAAA